MCIIGITKVMFYYAQGHHTRFILQVPNYGPTPIFPRLLNCAMYLSQRLGPKFLIQGPGGDTPVQDLSNVCRGPEEARSGYCSWSWLIYGRVGIVVLSDYDIMCLVILSE